MFTMRAGERFVPLVLLALSSAVPSHLLAEPQLGAPAANPAAPPSGPARRALVVGIDDYESHGFALAPVPSSGRRFRNLHGAVADARALADLLVERFGFPATDVVVLTDGAATREAILTDFEGRLVATARPGDIVLFYFGGHGSLVPNPDSDEPDKLDESLVPTDAGRGAADIRDKELRRLLNRVLDRGAFPTVILDSCHSGSGARGLPTGAVPRSLRPAARAVHDPGPYGPSPEERGALLLSAAQADGLAWETDDADGTTHGAFSWALLSSLRDLRAGEPAEETFQRVRARLQADRRDQEPVIEGTPVVLETPLFGAGAVSVPSRSVVAVERIDQEGKAILQGGWADGLTVGSRLTWTPVEGPALELEIVEMLGAGRAKARPLLARSGRAATPDPGPPARLAIPSGALLEITGWAAPQGRALQAWIPSWSGDFEPARELARKLAGRVRALGISWVVDPIGESPTHVLRWSGDAWQFLAPGEKPLEIGDHPTADEVLRRLPRGARFFLQLPLPEAHAKELEIGPGTQNDGIEPTADPASATVLLVGRWIEGGIEYAWLRPDSGAPDKASGLPAATPWRSLEDLEGNSLCQDLYHLRKLQGWLTLESPPRGDFEYRLALESARDSTSPAEGATLQGSELYYLNLQARPGIDLGRVRPRHLYVFTIDSQGNSTLLFGAKSDRNRLPFGLDGPDRLATAPLSIRLGDEPLVRVVAPFGRDSYFLLTTDEPLANPWILEYRGFRRRGPPGRTPLDELLSLTGGTGRRDASLVTPVGWSIERWSFLSIPGGVWATERDRCLIAQP